MSNYKKYLKYKQKYLTERQYSYNTIIKGGASSDSQHSTLNYIIQTINAILNTDRGRMHDKEREDLAGEIRQYLNELQPDIKNKLEFILGKILERVSSMSDEKLKIQSVKNLINLIIDTINEKDIINTINTICEILTTI